MSKKSILATERAKLIDEFNWEIRKLSSAVVVLASSIAQRIGMNPSDLECANILARMGPMTAGKLSELSGLTTGAITGVVDRLEKAGWAKRVADTQDRRRVIIQSVPQSPQYIDGLYESYAKAMSELISKYNDQELVLILEFTRRLSSLNFQEASNIKASRK